MIDCYYILDEEGNAKRVEEALDWAKWMENRKNAIIKYDEVKGYKISTVFLGINHNWFGSKPILFETMVFRIVDNHVDVYQHRYSTKEEALEGHKKAIEMANAGKFDD